MKNLPIAATSLAFLVIVAFSQAAQAEVYGAPAKEEAETGESNRGIRGVRVVSKNKPRVTSAAGASEKYGGMTRTWKISNNDHLSETLENWAKEAGYQFVWDAGDLQATSDIALEGSFEEAITSVVNALNSSGQEGLRAKFYQNNVLRIVDTSKGNK